MTSRFTAPFSYYGGKSRIAHLYPPPRYDTIIEPFCGAASYSFRYWEREVILNDLDEDTIAIWAFLTDPRASDLVERLVPAMVRPGEKISELVGEADPGLINLLRAEANQGTQGAKGVRDQITKRGALIWNKSLKWKLLEYVIPKVKHWQIRSVNYINLPTPRQPATWFIDPPYQNAAGAVYRTVEVDYTQLATWCQTRPGQSIVCENAGADWLPFVTLTTKRRGFVSSYQQSQTGEVYFEKSQ